MKCPLCSAVLSSASLESHLRSEIGYAGLRCLLCPLRFFSFPEAQRHFSGTFPRHPGEPLRVAETSDAVLDARLGELVARARAQSAAEPSPQQPASEAEAEPEDVEGEAETSRGFDSSMVEVEDRAPELDDSSQSLVDGDVLVVDSEAEETLVDLDEPVPVLDEPADITAEELPEEVSQQEEPEKPEESQLVGKGGAGWLNQSIFTFLAETEAGEPQSSGKAAPKPPPVRLKARKRTWRSRRRTSPLPKAESPESSDEESKESTEPSSRLSDKELDSSEAQPGAQTRRPSWSYGGPVQGYGSRAKAPCKLCGHAVERSNQKKHALIQHTDLRPFRCLKCLKAYSTKDHVKSHLKAKHKLVDYKYSEVVREEDFGVEARLARDKCFEAPKRASRKANVIPMEELVPPPTADEDDDADGHKVSPNFLRLRWDLLIQKS